MQLHLDYSVHVPFPVVLKSQPLFYEDVQTHQAGVQAHATLHGAETNTTSGNKLRDTDTSKNR